jgi:hypothetical protein
MSREDRVRTSTAGDVEMVTGAWQRTDTGWSMALRIALPD